MPLLLDALQNAGGPDYRKLRSKAMECAGLIGTYFLCIVIKTTLLTYRSAIAVGRDVFRPDAPRFIELLMGIQSGPRSAP